MKAKILFLFLFFSPLLSSASSLTELRDLYETTYSRDNSFCHYAGQPFELQIRSIDRYSQPDDRDYGEYPFIIQKGISYKVDFSQNIGRYRFIYSREKECSKTLTIPLNKDEITLFFAQDARPRPDNLVLVHYNPTTRTARIIHTNEPIRQYYQVRYKLFFSSYQADTQMSTIDFAGAKYNYIRSALPIWKKYENNQITVVLNETYNQFEWNNYFTDIEEFKKSFEWDEEKKIFKKNNFEIIFNYQLKKRCLHISQEWRCRSL